jgi:1,4-alpha-glucan branching enzyme
MVREDGGAFAAFSENARTGARYRFQLTLADGGQVTRTDPRCRQLATNLDCLVVDPFAFPWTDQAFRKPKREESVVYELHIGSFAAAPMSTQGTFAAAQGKLDELKDLGVNVIELMPVQHFGGSATSWGYNPHLFFAPKNSYGSDEDLKRFINEAHRRGIAVWLDIVMNHIDGWSRAPMACFDGWCPPGNWGIYTFPAGPWASTPWGPRPNYADPHVRRMLLESAQWWLREMHGDGFRWDSTSNLRANDGKGVAPFGKEFLIDANAITHAAGGLSIAEDLKGYEALTKAPGAGGFGFDAQWDGFGYDVMNLLVPFADDGRDLGVVQRLLTGGFGGDGFARLLWTENHDTVGNGGARLPVKIDPATPTSFAARRRSLLAATLMLTTPGIPMFFMGQEQLSVQGFPDPPPVLSAASDEGLRIRAAYRTLVALRRNLAGGTGALLEPGVEVLHFNSAAKVIAYRRFGPSRQEVVVVLNLRNRAYPRYDIGAPAGRWQVRYDADWADFGTDATGGQQGVLETLSQPYDNQAATLSLKLAPYGAVVLSR